MASAHSSLIMVVYLLLFINTNDGLSESSTFTNPSFDETSFTTVEAENSVANNSKELTLKTNDTFVSTTMINQFNTTDSAGVEDYGGINILNSTIKKTDWMNEYFSPSPHDLLQTTDMGYTSYSVSHLLNIEPHVTGCITDLKYIGTDYLMNITKPPTKATTAASDVTACTIKIDVPEGNFIDAFFDDFHNAFSHSCVLKVSICSDRDNICAASKTFPSDHPLVSCCRDFYHFKRNNVYIYVTAYSCVSFHILLRYRAVSSRLYHRLPAVNTSSSSGYVTTPGYDDNKNYPSSTRATFDLNITDKEVILISFPHFDLENHTSCRYDSLVLYAINQSETVRVDTWCGYQDIPSKVFYTSIRLRFYSDYMIQNSGFKMLFTIILKDQEPKMIADDLFDCSEPNFQEFAHHFNCNLAVNCVGKEDEMNCGYTSEECGPGLFDAGDKCYTYSRLKPDLSWYDAFSHCLTMNQTLVNPRNPREWRIFLGMAQHGRKMSKVYTGLRTYQTSGAAVPALYQDTWQWSDKTLGLYFHLNVLTNSVPLCTLFLPLYSSESMWTVSCVRPTNARYVCEKSKSLSGLTPDSVILPSLGSKYTWSKNVSVVQCPSGHVVRDFLSGDLQSQCRDERCESPCMTQGQIPMFQCEHSSQTVHYTLVCDFHLDCSDGSDESWCIPSPCSEDSCRSGQCISSGDRCDGMQHCRDASDENCPQMVKTGPGPVPPPALVNFDGRGQYSLQAMKNSDLCPPTHFQCADSYCLPLYVRCNGVEDCLEGEDEAGCEVYTCPEFFLCRGSRICLHPDHVCDGVLHCPQQDDERLCDLTCPEVCHCQGLAFVCAQSFPASAFPSLRYLDISGTRMTMFDLAHNFNLVHLRMSSCNLQAIEPDNLPNLRILDVSHNLLTSVKLDTLLSFQNLKELILSGNPLVNLVPARTPTIHNNFRTLSFSETEMLTVNGSIFMNFPFMKELNLSTKSLLSITEGFSTTPKLEVLDLRGSHELTYPSDMLKDLSFLRLLYANDFKLCCETALPESFDLENCYAPSDDIASCDDLLRSDLYRVFLWIFALLAVLGNVGSFVGRFYLQEKSFRSKGQNSFSVLVTNLNVADFLMGVYLTIIGVADSVYRGQYVWYVETWKHSVACQTAGFLSFASSEVSAFFICLITLDRLLILRFPFGKLRFRRKSALVVSGIAWIVGFALAAVPLLPMTPPWNFYSQTGICIPLPFSGQNRFAGYRYSFLVMIVLNLVLFVLIAVGQVFIYSAVRASSMAPAKKKSSRDSAIARRLTTVVLSDFLCWFPVGLLGVLASAGVPVSVNIRVGIAIFVLPFNSALNPFLYTFNIVMEKYRKATEARMLERLESRHFTELSRMDGRLPVQLLVTKETALNQIEGWLGIRVLTMSDLASHFDMMPRMIDSTTPRPE